VRFEISVQYIPGGTPQTGVIEEEAAIEELPSPVAGVPGTATPAPARPPGPGGRP
jgi:hypothetical protein